MVGGRRDMGILGLEVGQRAAGVGGWVHSRYLHMLNRNPAIRSVGQNPKEK